MPTFNDIQFKVKTRIDKKNELTFVGLGSKDLFDLNLDIEDPDEEQQYILSQIPVNEQWSYTLGGVYKHYEKHSFQTLVLSRSHFNNSAVKYLDNDDSSEANKTLDYSSEEMENKLRFENTSRFGDYKFNVGANIDFATYNNATQTQRFQDNEIVNIDYNTKLNSL